MSDTMKICILSMAVFLLVACDASHYDANSSVRSMGGVCVDNTFTVRRVDEGDTRILTITCKIPGDVKGMLK